MNAYAAAAVIVLGILSPGFKLFPQMPVFRGEDFALVPILLFLKPLSLRKNPLDYDGLRMRKAFAAMGILAAVSIMLSPLLYETEVIFNDWMILPMLFRYYLTLRVAQSVADEKGRRLCVTAAMAAFGLSAGVGLLQKFDLLSVNTWLTPYYYENAGGYLTSMGEYVGRIGGTHGDSRYYGAILVSGLGLLISLNLAFKRRAVKALAGVLILLVMAALISTLARTALYSAFCILTGAFFVYFRKRLIVGVLGALCMLGVAGLVFDQYRDKTPTGADAFMERVMDRDSLSYQGSKSARLRDLMIPFQDAWAHPAIFLIGRGPAKSELRTCAHNDYGWYFHRFGIPGLIFYLSILAWGIRLSYRRIAERPIPVDRAIYLAAFLVMLNWAIFAMSESIWKDGQLMTINMFFLGLAHGWVRPTGPDPRERFEPGRFPAGRNMALGMNEI